MDEKKKTESREPDAIDEALQNYRDEARAPWWRRLWRWLKR